MNPTIAIFLACTCIGLMVVIGGVPDRSFGRVLYFIFGLVATVYGLLGLFKLLVGFL